MAKTFTLTIKLGNDLMQTGADVAELLNRAADGLWTVEDLEAGNKRGVLDLNGASVGGWEVKRSRN